MIQRKATPDYNIIIYVLLNLKDIEGDYTLLRFSQTGIDFLVEFIFKETPRSGTLSYQGRNAFC